MVWSLKKFTNNFHRMKSVCHKRAADCACLFSYCCVDCRKSLRVLTEFIQQHLALICKTCQVEVVQVVSSSPETQVFCGGEGGNCRGG